MAAMLRRLGVPYSYNEPFRASGRSFLVDFLLPAYDVVIECTACNLAAHKTLSALLGRCLYLDFKARKIKKRRRDVVFCVLVEASGIDPSLLRDRIAEVFQNVDLVFVTMDELLSFICGLMVGSRATGRPSLEGISKEDAERALSFVARRRYRRVVLGTLASGPRTPTDVEKSTGLHLSHVSAALRELADRGLVRCENPSVRKGRLYRLTELGRAVCERGSMRAGSRVETF